MGWAEARWSQACLEGGLTVGLSARKPCESLTLRSGTTLDFAFDRAGLEAGRLESRSAPEVPPLVGRPWKTALSISWLPSSLSSSSLSSSSSSSAEIGRFLLPPRAAEVSLKVDCGQHTAQLRDTYLLIGIN